jgi:peptidoglycan hydrolase-like protein with peptidoglycan-binding domain
VSVASFPRLHRTVTLTTPHEHGRDIRGLQHDLAAFGTYHGKPDGEYGPLTAQAVYRAKYRLGYPKPDHKAGPVLEGYLTGRKHPDAGMVQLAHKRAKKRPVGITPAKRMLDFELTQVGTVEEPHDSNRQPYGSWYGENGVPWCAIFQSYSAAKVGLRFRYAYVPYVVADARAARNGLTLVHSSALFPGCLVCFDWNGDGVADHIGCFHGWVNRAQGRFSTVEGNTVKEGATGDQSNGGGVWKRDDRYLNEVLAFVKIGGST